MLSAADQNKEILWPYRPKLLPEELLSSYLIRIANGLFLRPISLLTATWGSSRSLLNQDLDNMAPDHVIDAIAAHTGNRREAIFAATLQEMDGRLARTYNATGRNTWILPTTIKSNHRRRHGLQYCPVCIASPVGYFRRTWRLALATICTEHSVLLRDACPECGDVLHPHRAPSIRQCFSCGANLSIAPTPAPSHRLVVQQRKFEASLARGWAMLYGDPVYSHVYFAIVRQIAALLVNGPKAPLLRRVTVRDFGGDDAPYDKPTDRQPIEYLRVGERLRLLDLVERLMEGFPAKFVHACQEAGIFRSHAAKDMPDPPFAYEDVLRGYLDATPYQANDAEVANAAAWLRRTQGRATYGMLKEICGESVLTIYRHMDYVRKPAVPSINRTRAFKSSH